MPYQAEQDVTLSRIIGYRPIPGTDQKVATKESVNYVAGAIVFEKDMTPDVLTRLEEGDDHLSTLLRYIDVAEAQRILGVQVQAASRPSAEDEILHQEERFGGGALGGPTLAPEVEVGPQPPYEAPVVEGGGQVSDSATGSTTVPPSVEDPQEVVTEKQTVGQGTEPATTVEEAPEGSTESTGAAEDEVVEEVQQETDTEAAEAATEDQATGQDQPTETQEQEAAVEETKAEAEVEGDRYDAMDLDALKAEVKARKIPGRTKLKTEDELRAALRK